jgi:hypothetical protein
MSASEASLEPLLQSLKEVRLNLLRLHKALLHLERDAYEETYGSIKSKGEFLQLVLNDDWFSWLRPMSQFIVQVDDVLHARDPVSARQINELLAEAKTLVNPNQDGTNLEQRYFSAIQRDPEIALMHAEITRLLED